MSVQYTFVDSTDAASKMYEVGDPRRYTYGDLPEHLGGHEYETHIDRGAVSKLVELFDCKSVIDVGCGPGGMLEHFHSLGMDFLGIDGDYVVERPPHIADHVATHDYETGPYIPEKTYDLAWCVEFVEHIWAKHMPNFIETFKKAKYVIFTHAVPGQAGHHHVNCQNTDYWVGVMNAHGFDILVEETKAVRAASTMQAKYIVDTGLVFKNNNI